MKPRGKAKAWRETHVRLARATLTTFTGPGPDLTVVLHGLPVGAARTSRHVGARPGAKGGR